MDSIAIYDKLYDIAAEKTILPVSKEVFLATIGEDMEHCNLLKLHGLNRRDFAVGIYTVVFRRLPESEDVIEGIINEDLPEQLLRGAVIKSILSSSEYLANGMTCFNNVFSGNVYNNGRPMTYKRKCVEWLQRVYQKTPQWLRSIKKRLEIMVGMRKV